MAAAAVPRLVFGISTRDPRRRRDLPRRPYSWDRIPPHNRLALSLLRRAAPFVRILDAAAFAEERPDRHASKGDCLHYCQPGPVDWWNKVLLALLET